MPVAVVDLDTREHLRAIYGRHSGKQNMKSLLKIIVSVIALMALSSFVRAEPVKITNVQANELLQVLSQVGPGLTAQNTTRLARNINALRPAVEAATKGDQAAQTRLGIKPETKRDSVEGLAYLAEQKKNNEDEITLDLNTITFTDEEIVAAKISPVIMSVIIKHLDPKPATPPPTKK